MNGQRQLKESDIRLTSGEMIDETSVQLNNFVERGGYGTIYTGRWNGKDVAVKLFDRDIHGTYRAEIEQLSRVRHINIIEFYGVYIGENGFWCMITEYADCGSLFYLLHSQKAIHYDHWNAIDWALQCARGVYYLHSLTPKPVVHGDLKTPNLLLCNRGSLLKICDFGNACEAGETVSKRKGSFAWMAPEVYEGGVCSENWDVYSWSIIFWELLSRRIPFEDLDSSSFEIFWAVYSGKRPPDVPDCPSVLNVLMKQCWHSYCNQRPSMQHVVATLEDYVSKVSSGPPPPLNLDAKIPETDNVVEVFSLSE